MAVDSDFLPLVLITDILLNETDVDTYMSTLEKNHLINAVMT